MVERKSLSYRIRMTLTYSIVIALGLICFIPVWNMVCYSFSSAVAIQQRKVSIIPVDFNLDAYAKILSDEQFWVSFWISVKRVGLSLILNVVLIVLMAYPLSKSSIDFRGRNVYMYFLLFAMLFSGGMIPTYLVVKRLKLINTIWALVLPGAVPIFNLIMVMNFFKGIPKSLEEAAMIDGASPFRIMMQIYVPCAKPSIATVALFSIVGNWNDFFSGLIYMTKKSKYPIMTYIESIRVNLLDLMQSGASSEDLALASNLSGLNLTAAKIVVAVIPLMLIYPLLQKYLISGIVLGAVKE